MHSDPPGSYGQSYTSTLSGNRFELGAGYFKKLGNRSLFEAFGGYGNGSLTDDYGVFSTRYHRLFAHAEAGFHRNSFSVLGGLQLAMHRYYGFSSPDSTLRYIIAADHFQTHFDFTRQNYFFLQPFINIEGGRKNFTFNTQIGFSGQFHNKNTDQIDKDANIYVSMGLAYRFRY